MDRFSHSYKECFVLYPNRCGITQSTHYQGSASSLALIPLSNRYEISQSTPFGPAFLLAHRSVSGFDTIFNRPNLPLADVVLFGFPFRYSPQGFKTRLLGRGFHTLINNASFSSPTDVGSHNPPIIGAQRPHWHSFLSPIDMGSHSPPLRG